jgi:hypothetical protein
MKQSWSDWSNTNQNGREVGPIFCPYPCFGLTITEQAGHGIVNLKLGFMYPDGTEGWTGWITENMGGSERKPIRCPTGKFATGIKVREQEAKGLVNIRLIDSDGNDTSWATENQNGSENTPLKVPQGNAVTGIFAREQAGYEIINVKIHYQPK